MLNLGLTAKERGVFEETLRSSHVRRIDVDVLTLDETVLSSIDTVLLSGQVTVDMDAEVTRSASLEFLDPSHSLNFDTDSPDQGALYADRMIRIRYGVYVPGLSRWVDVPVFMGPVTGLSRAQDVVRVEAQGKEALVRGATWQPLTLKKGMQVVGAIRMLLVQQGGESRLSLPQVRNSRGKPVTLPKARSLDRLTQIWATALGLARGVNRQLFYDGRGVAVLRKLPGQAVYTYRTGDTALGQTGRADVLGNLSVSYNLADVKNTVEVKGQPPKGKKGKVRGVAIANRNHVLSPWRLGRKIRQGGKTVTVPTFLVESVEDQSIRSDAAARRRARQILGQRLDETVEVSFDSLPIPHLDPGDKVGLRTADFSTNFRLKKFTIPLTADGVSSVGYLKRVTPTRRRKKK